MPLMVIKLLFSTMYTRSPFFIKPVASMLTGGVNASYVDPNMKRMFALIDSYLAKDGGRQFIAGGDAQGAPTAADFLLLFPLEAGIGSGRLPDDATATPRIREYVQRCQERPAYKRALDKGPKYNYGETCTGGCPALSHEKLADDEQSPWQARSCSLSSAVRSLSTCSDKSLTRNVLSPLPLHCTNGNI